jgi:NAD+ kinase
VKFGIVGNLEKERLPFVVGELLKRVHRGEIEFLMADTLAKAVKSGLKREIAGRAKIVSEKKLLIDSDMIIALGGDGTILRTARFVGSYEKPIVGINLGKLGFLAEVSLDEIEGCFVDILEGRFVVEDRMMLQGKGAGLPSTFVALNDIVIDKYGTSRVMSIETYVGNDYLATYAADGIIVSTPTGSTGYSLANGGPIVTPACKAITIGPICPHTLTARPVIVPEDSVITVKIASAANKAHVTADGQLEKLFDVPLSITIGKAPFRARLVRRPNTNYYDVLRKKLNWGSDVRIKPKA